MGLLERSHVKNLMGALVMGVRVVRPPFFLYPTPGALVWHGATGGTD